MRLVSVIHSIRQSVYVAGCAVVLGLVASAAPLERFKADYACRALVTDPATAANLQRPPALRYRAAPVRAACLTTPTGSQVLLSPDRLAFA
jgi:hypothetical protein